MEELIPTVGALMFKTWGVFGLLVLLLGFLWLRAERNHQAERDKNDKLQAARVEDAKSMTAVIESATAVIASRSAGDQRWTELHAVLVDKVSTLETMMSSLQATLQAMLLQRPPRFLR